MIAPTARRGVARMNRRDVLISALSAYFAYSCGCAAQAAAEVVGCRHIGLADIVEAAFWSKVIPMPGYGMPPLPPIKLDFDLPFGDMRFGTKQIDFRTSLTYLTDAFGVRPAFRAYDDAPAPNAFAVPTAKFPEEGPDGVVLLGALLVAKELERFPVSRVMGAAEPGQESILLILAHEWAHILQFKNGMASDKRWQMEPHADFMAGWFFAQKPRLDLSNLADWYIVRDIENAAKTMFSRGDTRFNDPGHHGQPEFRAAMVRAGYESGDLDVKAAFDKGLKWAGL
jgi:hypothetical protein